MSFTDPGFETMTLEDLKTWLAGNDLSSADYADLLNQLGVDLPTALPGVVQSSLGGGTTSAELNPPAAGTTLIWDAAQQLYSPSTAAPLLVGAAGSQLAKAYSSTGIYTASATTLTALDGTNLSIAVTVPPSGAFMVRLMAAGAAITGGSGSHSMTWGLLGHGTSTQYGELETALQGDYNTPDGYARSAYTIVEIDVAGQTAGATLQLDFAYKVDAGSTTNGSIYGPVKMKAYAT